MDGEEKESPYQLILGMIDVGGDLDQGLETEDIGVDPDLDHDQEEDRPIAVIDAEVIVLEPVHRPEDEEVENAPGVEAMIGINTTIDEVVEDKLKPFRM